MAPLNDTSTTRIRDIYLKEIPEQERIPVSSLLEMKTNLKVLDVRTHEEYCLGHIPNAISLELFNSDERAQLGRMYKELGREDAVKLGFNIVNPKIANLVEEIENCITDDKVLVHCWRGGMRSASMAWLVSLSLEKEVFIIDGGYKAYRNFVLDTFQLDYNFMVVGGYTGSAKTEVLGELRNLGEQVIDLEAIALHRGSAFGGIGLDQQPSQQNFENLLAEELRTIDTKKPIWIEDESRRIGSRTIPLDLFNTMKKSTLVFLNIPFDNRIDHLMNSYGTFDADNLIRAAGKLERRLGREKMNQVKKLIEAGNIREACVILLRYYDKSYEHGLSKKQEGKISQIHCELVDPQAIAKQLLERTTHGIN